MIKDGKRYLNLEDQVEWNKNHIEAFLAGIETVNIFGIRVLAVVPTPEDIPLQETYSYGDAYAVGETPPYHYYVYTRSGLEAIEGTFVDIGEFPGKGADGATPYIGSNGNWWIKESDTGVSARGEQGYTPYIGANEHWYINGVDTGVSARGPAGIGLRGPQGLRGKAGGYRLYGELSSISQLPTPTKAIQDDDGAYIIAGDLWMVMGLTSLEWYNLGKVGGTGMRGEPGVGIDSMTKLTTPYGEGTVTYDTTDGIHLSGQTRIDYGDDFSKQVDTDTALPIKAGVGVSMDATEDGKHIEIKADETWVNESIDSKVNPVKTGKRDIVQPAEKGKAARIYSVTPISDSYPEGAQGYLEAGTSNFTQYSVPQRAANGQLNLPDQLTYIPSNSQAVSKKYMDSSIAAKTNGKLDAKAQPQYLLGVPTIAQNTLSINKYYGIQETRTNTSTGQKEYSGGNYIPLRGAYGHVYDYYKGIEYPLITSREAEDLYGGGVTVKIYNPYEDSYNAERFTEIYNNLAEGKVCVVQDDAGYLSEQGITASKSMLIVGAVYGKSFTAVSGGAEWMDDNGTYQTDDRSLVIATWYLGPDGYVYIASKSMYSYDDFVTRLSFDGRFPADATNGDITIIRWKEIIQNRDRSIISFNKEIYYKADVGHQAGYVTYTHTGYENSKFIHKAITINTNNWSWVLNTSE